LKSVAAAPTVSAAPGSTRWGRALPWVLVGLATLVGLALRAASFSDSLYADELSAYFVVTGHAVGEILDLVQSDQEITPPLFFLLARLTQGVGGSTDSLRWVPMFAGLASIPLTYLLGLRTLTRRAALVGAAVMALSPFLIFYSTEARPYALLMVLCLSSTLVLLRALERRNRWWWAIYALLSCAAMYTHYTGIFVLASQAAWALAYHREAWRCIVGANLVAALGWLPWLSSYRADQDSPGSAVIGLLQPFDFEAFRTDVLHWAIGHPFSFPLRDMPGDTALMLMGLGIAIGLVGIAIAIARGAARLPAEGTVLIAILALSTPVLAGIYSAVSVSVFLPRNLIASSPGLALALAAIVTAPTRRALWVPATALLIAGFAIAGTRMLEDDLHRPDYKGVAAFIADHDGGPAVTVDAPAVSPGPITALDAALTPNDPAPPIPALRVGRAPHAAEWLADQADGPGQFGTLPVPMAETIARQARERAGDQAIFLVAGGDFTLDELRGRLAPDADAAQHARTKLATTTSAAAFVRALPPDYRATARKVFPGLFGYGTVTAYQLARPPKD
jgi:mannosyltransferase